MAGTFHHIHVNGLKILTENLVEQELDAGGSREGIMVEFDRRYLHGPILPFRIAKNKAGECIAII